jgi:ankyrin repeat protein
MVQYLVQRGAQINQRTAEGQTARDLAGAAGHTAVVKYLTQIMPRPQTQARGQTQSPIEDGATNALYEAIDGNDPMKAQVAIEAGAYLSHEDEARTPLRWAIARGTEQANEIAAALVQAGVPLHGIDRQGYTPLSVAIQLHNKRLARLLLRKGARLAPEESEAYQALVAEHEHSA